MKIGLKILAAVISASLIFPIGYNSLKSVAFLNKSVYNYLVLGLDESEINSDIICIISYNSASREITFINIPRDTYYDIGVGNSKINQVYFRYLQKSDDKKAALMKVADEFSLFFGIDFEGSIIFTHSAFKNIVNTLGGVKIELPQGYSLKYPLLTERLNLNDGENHLFAEESLYFVRYRQEFATGDIGRIENRNIFIFGLYKTIFEFYENEGAAKLFNALNKDLTYDFSYLELFLLFLKEKSSFGNSTLNSIIIPGYAKILDNGFSYYIINVEKANNLLFEIIGEQYKGISKSERLIVN